MRQALAMDVGPSAIMIAAGRGNAREVTIEQRFRLELPPGCVVDGAVADRATFKSSLVSGLSGHKLKSRNTMVCIHTGSAIQRLFEVPASSLDELESLVDYELKQYLPAGREYAVDYIVKRRFLNEQGSRVVQVKAMGVPKDICDTYYDVIAEIGLRPVAMDVHMQGASKIFEPGVSINGYEVPDGAICILDFSTFQTIIHFMVDGEIDLSRTLPIGMANLERTVADRLRVSPEEVQIRLKSDLRIHEADAEMMESVRRFFNQLIQELRKIVQYARMKTPPVSVERVYIYGSGSDAPWMERLFQENIEIETAVVRDHGKIHLTPRAGDVSLSSYLNAAAMLMRA